MDGAKDWPIDRFLRDVASAVNRDDRGYLAELRRGLSKTTEQQAWEHLIPYCADFENEERRATWCIIGGLAALLVPDGLSISEPWSNLGTTMRALAKGDGDRDETKALKSFEPKFRRALSCDDVVSLCEIVVGIARAADVKGVPVNLRNLFWDIWNWADPDKRDDIRLKWSKQYFRVFEPRVDVANQGGVME